MVGLALFFVHFLFFEKDEEVEPKPADQPVDTDAPKEASPAADASAPAPAAPAPELADEGPETSEEAPTEVVNPEELRRLLQQGD